MSFASHAVASCLVHRRAHHLVRRHDCAASCVDEAVLEDDCILPQNGCAHSAAGTMQFGYQLGHGQNTRQFLGVQWTQNSEKLPRMERPNSRSTEGELDVRWCKRGVVSRA
eukprot:IDg1542t1